jgi:hypothetical protein
MESKERNRSEVILELISLFAGLLAMWAMVASGLFESLILYADYIAMAVAVVVLMKIYGLALHMPKGKYSWSKIRSQYQNRFASDMLLLSFLTGYATL